MIKPNSDQANIYFIYPLFFLSLFCSCNSQKNQPDILDINFIGKPLVPRNIVWNNVSTLYQADEEANFKTFYFYNDSIVFTFNCLNQKPIKCIDTSIFDKQSNIYNDTAFCHYEDSILFAVEDLEMNKGKYQIKGENIICELKNVNEGFWIDKQFIREEVFFDTLRLITQKNKLSYKNETYQEAVSLKAESRKKILGFVTH